MYPMIKITAHFFMLQALQSLCILAGNKSTMIIIVSKRTITERANHVDCKVLWRAPFTSMKRILPCYYEKAGEAVLFIYLCQKASSIMFIFSLHYIIIVVITIFHIFHTKLQVLGWSFLHIISSWLLLSARSLRKKSLPLLWNEYYSGQHEALQGWL